MHILLVEDTPGIARFVTMGLEEEGHTVQHVASLDAARAALGASAFDLCLLDRRLPDGDGLALLPALHASGRSAVIVLTARDTVADRVEGLNAGADDYLIKPFAFEELLARIEAVRRRAPHEGAVHRFGPLRVDLDALRVFVGDDELALTPTEFRLLRHFVEHQGRVCTRARLLDAVWDSQPSSTTNVVDVYVRYLRSKLADAGVPPLIHTVRGRGYLFEAREP